MVRWNVVNHPHQLAYFNGLVGGLGGAQRRGVPDATDYWGLSYRQGMAWLDRHAPRGAMVIAGVGDHVVRMPRRLWLRPDLLLRDVRGLAGGRPVQPRHIETLVRRWPGAVYAIYVTRRGMYAPWLRALDRRARPVHRITVDGGDVLRIVRLRGRGGNAPGERSAPTRRGSTGRTRPGPGRGP